MAKGVAFEQISTRKGLGADLALIWLFLGVHSHVTTQVIEARIALGALAAGVQTGSSTWPGAGGRLGVLLLLPRLSIAGGGRVGGGGGLVPQSAHAFAKVRRCSHRHRRRTRRAREPPSPWPRITAATTTTAGSTSTRANDRSRDAAEPILSRDRLGTT